MLTVAPDMREVSLESREALDFDMFDSHDIAKSRY